MKITKTAKGYILLLLLLAFGVSPKSVSAQDSPSVLYIPLIGITSVPSPLALPLGAGNVTYDYAVKNFLHEIPLTNVAVVDDKCSTVVFVEGDDNGDSRLDYSETWRYTCTTRLTSTTQNTATATGIANSLTAKHIAYSTVIVGSEDPAPLVSVVNITKVAHPLSLPSEGGDITFTYKVNNPGVVPLSGVSVSDDKCRQISSRLGDTNVNNLLDTHEVWVYTCTAHLSETTTNTVKVTAFANGLSAFGEATITVEVDTPPIPGFPETGMEIQTKVSVWLIMLSMLLALTVFYFLTRRKKK